MAGIAAGWFLEDLQLSSSALPWTVGLLLAWLPAAMVVQLVVSFPDGRMWSWPARAVLAGAFLVTVGRAVLGALFLPDGRNLLLVSRHHGVVDAVGHDASYLGLVVTIALAVLIVLRLRSLRGVARRVALPPLGGALLMLPFFAVWFAAYVLGETFRYASGSSNQNEPISPLNIQPMSALPPSRRKLLHERSLQAAANRSVCPTIHAVM